MSEHFPRMSAFPNGMQSQPPEMFPQMNIVPKGTQPPPEQFPKMNAFPENTTPQHLPNVLQNKITQPPLQPPQHPSAQEHALSPNNQAPKTEPKPLSTLFNGPPNSVPGLTPGTLNSNPNDRLSSLPDQFQKMSVYSNGTEFPATSVSQSKVTSPHLPQSQLPSRTISQFNNQQNSQQTQVSSPSSNEALFNNTQRPLVQQSSMQQTPQLPSNQSQLSNQQKLQQMPLLPSSQSQFSSQQQSQQPPIMLQPSSQLSSQNQFSNQQKPLVQQTYLPPKSQNQVNDLQKPPGENSTMMHQASVPQSGQSQLSNQQKLQQTPLLPSSQSQFSSQQLSQQPPIMQQPSSQPSSQNQFSNQQKPLVQQTYLPPRSQNQVNDLQKPPGENSTMMQQASLPRSGQSQFSNQQKPLGEKSPQIQQTSLPPSSQSQVSNQQKPFSQQSPLMQQIPLPSNSQSQFSNQQIPQSQQMPQMPLPPSNLNQFSNQQKHLSQNKISPPGPNQFSNHQKLPSQQSPLIQQTSLPPSSQNQLSYQQKPPFQQAPSMPPSSQQKSPHMSYNNLPLSGPPIVTSSSSQRPPSISQQYPKVNTYYNGTQPPLPPSSMPNKTVLPTQPQLQPPYPQNQFGSQPNSPYVSPNNAMPAQSPLQPNQNFTQPQYSNQNYSSNMMNRYPQQPGMSGPNVVQGGMNKAWGMEICDLLKVRDILPPEHEDPPAIKLQQELLSSLNCSPSIFRSTLTKIPETKALLDKSRLPLGVLIHPFKDLTKLTVIQSSVIVRCRACRTYINPFIHFVDNKHWKCNLCFRVNELPDDFQYDPTTRTYGDPSRRPEIKSSTLEFIAPSEYMVRPPQPAVYLFLLDVSRLATQSGYLSIVCETILAHLDNLPGDARTSIGIIAYDNAVHFYSLAPGSNRPHEMTVLDVDDIFLPCPDNLLVNLNECKELVCELLSQLPKKYKESFATDCALGAALQAGYKLLAPSGGRITVFQTCLPNLGPGKLAPREDPALRASENVQHLNPFTDFYKKLALDCSAQQIAVDLFVINSQYVDIASLAGISKFSGGSVYHIPLFSAVNQTHVENLEKMFTRYLIRKIGFESVMRLRCTRGVSIHTFHGNFFVRSTDLLSLPNVNPDAGYGMQVSIDENLTDISNVCFQAALLYTSSQGERRIRVHTLCLPVASSLQEILYSADQECIVGILSKMAVDRSAQASLSDAREAFVNAVVDILTAFRTVQSYGGGPGSLLAPNTLRLLPLYVLALLKHVAFRVGSSTRLDDRVFAMNQMKCLPLTFLIQSIYPDLYPVHFLDQVPEVELEDKLVPQPPRLQLSSERIDKNGIYLMDAGDSFILYVGHNVNPQLLNNLLGVPHFSAIPDISCGIAELETPESERLRNFIILLCVEKPYCPPITVLRDNSTHRSMFLERLVEDKYDSGISYYEFLQRIKAQVK